jgi:pimeloyl-ACP methyl ester carboxylesterase
MRLLGNDLSRPERRRRCRLSTVDGEVVSGMVLRQRGDPVGPGILLWPGLGSTGAYFADIAEALPGRAVSVDPPGFGGSAPLDPCTYERLVEMASAAVDQRGCKAMVGHSLGAHVALGVGCDPPAGLEAIVLIDGGFLTAEDFNRIGVPVLSGRTELVVWAQSNELSFPDWATATRRLAEIFATEITPAFEAYVHEVMVEVDGEVREASSPERAADLLLAVADQDVVALARRLAVPTLLIACGQPPDLRAIKQRAWQAFVSASPMVDLRVVDEWGHNPLLQAPEASSGLIADWLRAHI